MSDMYDWDMPGDDEAINGARLVAYVSRSMDDYAREMTGKYA